MKRREVVRGYEPLARVLEEALNQASRGKGKQRHAKNGVPFLDQPIIAICEMLGSEDFALGQAIKKILESKRLPRKRAERDLLGAKNYIAAAILARRRRELAKKR